MTSSTTMAENIFVSCFSSPICITVAVLGLIFLCLTVSAMIVIIVMCRVKRRRKRDQEESVQQTQSETSTATVLSTQKSVSKMELDPMDMEEQRSGTDKTTTADDDSQFSITTFFAEKKVATHEKDMTKKDPTTPEMTTNMDDCSLLCSTIDFGTMTDIPEEG